MKVHNEARSVTKSIDANTKCLKTCWMFTQTKQGWVTRFVWLAMLLRVGFTMVTRWNEKCFDQFIRTSRCICTDGSVCLEWNIGFNAIGNDVGSDRISKSLRQLIAKDAHPRTERLPNVSSPYEVEEVSGPLHYGQIEVVTTTSRNQNNRPPIGDRRITYRSKTSSGIHQQVHCHCDRKGAMRPNIPQALKLELSNQIPFYVPIAITLPVHKTEAKMYAYI